MERVLLAAVVVLAFSVVASWFTRRRWIAVLAVAEEIVALPPREAGPLVRYLMAQ